MTKIFQIETFSTFQVYNNENVCEKGDFNMQRNNYGRPAGPSGRKRRVKKRRRTIRPRAIVLGVVILIIVAIAIGWKSLSQSGTVEEDQTDQQSVGQSEQSDSSVGEDVQQSEPSADGNAQPSETAVDGAASDSEPDIEVVDGLTYVNGILIANKSYSLPADYNPGVLPEAQSAFDEMAEGAAKDGIKLYIASGFRSYDYQAGLYQRYVERDGAEMADTYSARPGHSEHQTGLAFDLNEISDAFAGTPEAEWLAEHAHEYGFIIRYPADKEDITGYSYEPWHVRYLGKEIAEKVYESGLCLEEYLGIDSVYAD